MRDRPWLEPCVWPTWNCSWISTSCPRCASRHAVAAPMTPAPTIAIRAIERRTLARPDRIAQHPDPLDLELDDVPRLEPAAVAVLEDATRPDRAGAEDVAAGFEK